MFSLNYKFSLLSSVLCTPIDNNVLQKNSLKMNLRNSTSSEKKIFQHSCVTLMLVFTGPFKIVFSWIEYSMTKTNYNGKCFFNFGSLYTHWQQWYSKLLKKKHSGKIFFLKGNFLFPSSFVCTPIDNS